jgi:hypothetical protein
MVSHIEGRLQTENIQEQCAVINSRRDKLRGQWRKLHNKELHDLYSSSNNMMIKRRRTKCLEEVACMRELKNAYTVLVRRSERQRLLGRTWHVSDSLSIRNT